MKLEAKTETTKDTVKKDDNKSLDFVSAHSLVTICARLLLMWLYQPFFRHFEKKLKDKKTPNSRKKLNNSREKNQGLGKL